MYSTDGARRRASCTIWTTASSGERKEAPEYMDGRSRVYTGYFSSSRRMAGARCVVCPQKGSPGGRGGGRTECSDGM